MLDWTFTATTLTLYEWIKFEEILSCLFERRVELAALRTVPRNKGDKQTKLNKFLQAH